ncbi:MAG: hypothetical protein R2780_13475 [Crocinitomicaceae bacterium]|nr:hypothetical protein [Crocinitomicaceae bacterium]
MNRYLLIFVLFLVSCVEDPSIERGFYHWKQELDLTKEDKAFLNDIGAEYLYVKYFDVIWKDDQAIPVSILNVKNKPKQEVVPVVFITPDVFSNLDSSGVEDLAKKVGKKIRDVNHKLSNFEEIQIDCDWMPSIKDKYFYFLSKLGQEFEGSILSATIRLYQYKYPDLAGVPPVDKGLLMYYNMGDFSEYRERNSILNNKTGKQYLGSGDYPLPMDIALPNFRWSLLFRQGNFKQICPNFTETQLNDQELFTKMGNNKFIFNMDTVMYDTYFRYGDELRYESCSEEELLLAVDLLKKEIGSEKIRVLIYDLQNETKDEYEKLDAVFSAFE